MIGWHSYPNNAPPIPDPAPAGRRSLTLLLLAAAPGLAEVLAEGKPKGGYYWQKVSGSNGTKMLCRSNSDPEIQNAASCATAGAVKPQ